MLVLLLPKQHSLYDIKLFSAKQFSTKKIILMHVCANNSLKVYQNETHFKLLYTLLVHLQDTFQTILNMFYCSKS